MRAGESSARLRAMSYRIASFPLVFTLLLGACGGFDVQPVTPSPGVDSALATATVARVEVATAPEMAEDKLRMMERFDVLGVIQQRVGQSFEAAGKFDAATPGLSVRITVDEFRNGRYGPAFMGASVVVVDAAGQVVEEFHVREETRRMSNRTNRLGIVTQGIVTQVVQGV